MDLNFDCGFVLCFGFVFNNVQFFDYFFCIEIINGGEIINGDLVQDCKCRRRDVNISGLFF